MDEREQDAEDKTEEASEERRKQYREKGNVANPREIAQALSLLVLALFLAASAGTVGHALQRSFHRAWGDFSVRGRESASFLGEITLGTSAVIVPSLGVLVAALILFPTATGLLFTKFNWSWKKLEFTFEKLNPVSGLQRLVSPAILLELAKTLLKFTVFTFVVAFILKREAFHLVSLPLKSLGAAMPAAGASIMRLVGAMAGAAIVVGIADFAFNWWKLEREMRMTKQDIKEEMKSQEGDPHVKGQRRRMAREIVLRKSIAQVPKATFVVTNPEHFAVAIRYVRGMPAPIVVAKGQDFLALKIREVAKAHDICIVENKPLARTLYKTVKLGQEIPPSLYASVIEVMKYIHETRGKNYFDRFNLAS